MSRREQLTTRGGFDVWTSSQRTCRGSMMGLHGYGLLIGKVVASRPQRPGKPHWLLMVQPGNSEYPAYRVAVNLQPRERGQPPELQYQIVQFDGRSSHGGTRRRCVSLKMITWSRHSQRIEPMILSAYGFLPRRPRRESSTPIPLIRVRKLDRTMRLGLAADTEVRCPTEGPRSFGRHWCKALGANAEATRTWDGSAGSS
jgi:hypothetical protein